MEAWYEVKVRARLGPGEFDDKEATLLGRILRWHDWGISCEADPKHREKILEEMEITAAGLRTVSTDVMVCGLILSAN